MILELAILYVAEETQAMFESDFARAGSLINSINGYKNHSLQKCVEQADKYVLLVQWEKLDDHTIGFRQSAQYNEWKRLLHHYYDPFPVVEHYEMVLENHKSTKN